MSPIARPTASALRNHIDIGPSSLAAINAVNPASVRESRGRGHSR
jgi:hypothetical protein